MKFLATYSLEQILKFDEIDLLGSLTYFHWWLQMALPEPTLTSY